jgi:hypothetical protein
MKKPSFRITSNSILCNFTGSDGVKGSGTIESINFRREVASVCTRTSTGRSVVEVPLSSLEVYSPFKEHTLHRITAYSKIRGATMTVNIKTLTVTLSDSFCDLMNIDKSSDFIDFYIYRHGVVVTSPKKIREDSFKVIKKSIQSPTLVEFILKAYNVSPGDIPDTWDLSVTGFYFNEEIDSFVVQF